MCFTSTASFITSGFLIAGGVYGLQRALKTDHRYCAMAVMPIAVGVQQAMEGLAWIGAEQNMPELLSHAALFYMAFVWCFWPCWTAFMTARLEPNEGKKRLLLRLSLAGLLFGLMLYLPYFWHPDWLRPTIMKHSLLYATTLLPDFIVPRGITSLVYLFFIAAPPLLSSHVRVRRFGLYLMVFVPLTYLFFAYAYISVLCFFAALMTMDLIAIIARDCCGNTKKYTEGLISG